MGYYNNFILFDTDIKKQLRKLFTKNARLCGNPAPCALFNYRNILDDFLIMLTRMTEGTNEKYKFLIKGFLYHSFS